jgi:hypothetical protein
MGKTFLDVYGLWKRSLTMGAAVVTDGPEATLKEPADLELVPGQGKGFRGILAESDSARMK